MNTYFWIDPQEDLLGVFLVQRHPAAAGVYAGFPGLVYRALVECAPPGPGRRRGPISRNDGVTRP